MNSIIDNQIESKRWKHLLEYDTFGTLRLYNKKVVIIYEEISTHIIFEAIGRKEDPETEAFILDKEKQVLHKMEAEAFNRLIVKIASINLNDYIKDE